MMHDNEACNRKKLQAFGLYGKFCAIKDTAAIKRGTIISTIFCVVISCGAYLVGSTSRLILNGTLSEAG